MPLAQGARLPGRAGRAPSTRPWPAALGTADAAARWPRSTRNSPASLLAAGRAPWQVLAGAAQGADLAGELLLRGRRRTGSATSSRPGPRRPARGPRGGRTGVRRRLIGGPWSRGLAPGFARTVRWTDRGWWGPRPSGTAWPPHRWRGRASRAGAVRRACRPCRVIAHGVLGLVGAGSIWSLYLPPVFSSPARRPCRCPASILSPCWRAMSRPCPCCRTCP